MPSVARIALVSAVHATTKSVTALQVGKVAQVADSWEHKHACMWSDDSSATVERKCSEF